MKKSTGRDEIQGEGDYKSGRRFNEASKQFVESHDVETLGRESAPHSAQEARELERAEAAGRSRAQGTRSAKSEDLAVHSEDGVRKLITAEGYVHQRPWMALGIAAAVGALLGALSARR
jgi:ElaB/YqjD/DUF883 family membrane-anchored ribosome-binding protein